jgi:hypothetical protein
LREASCRSDEVSRKEGREEGKSPGVRGGAEPAGRVIE